MGGRSPRKEDEQDEISTVLGELGLQLDREQIERMLLGLTDADVQAARDAVRKWATDEERLLAAVGEAELRRRLPSTLIAILERSQGSVVGIRAAMAAVATFHTGALREYRDALVHLDPPKQWAGNQRAVEFVRSLGFGEEWAGERNPRREPYVEVEGPYSLPELHDYQRKVVGTGIPQIKPTFLDIAPSGIPSIIIPHSKGVKCGLIRSNSPFSYSNHRPAKPKIPKPLVSAQVSPLGTSFATP